MKYEFESHFSTRLHTFVEQKNALGFPYHESIRLLRNFDRFCLENFPTETSLTKEINHAWAIKKDTEGNNTFRNRLMPIREFARYLNRCGEAAFVLPSDFAKEAPRCVPHIYSEDELLTIWQILDETKQSKFNPYCSTRHLVIPIIFRLIYYCGLRPCEARRLRVDDVDLNKGRLNIIESKGYKSRIIMMADDVTQMCQQYDHRVSSIMPEREIFFPKSNGQAYSKDWINEVFQIARDKAGIVTTDKYLPRLYDFRHTFATHRLYQWMREGKDITAKLPYLSAYMGHTQLSKTYYYIHLIPGLFEEMAEFDFSPLENLLPEVNDNE